MIHLPNLLIVDDSKANLTLLANIIKKIKVNLIQALSGSEALEKTLGIELALAIIDVRMPEMDGYELAKRMNEERPHEKAPIIFITASNFDEMHVFEGYDSGAVDYIFKPIVPYILLCKIKVFLDLFNQKQTIIRETALHKKSAEELTIVNAALKKSEKKYRRYIDNAPDSVFVADETGKYLEVNKATCRITGYSKDELLKMSISDILPEESFENALDYLKEVINTGISKADLIFRHKNGTKRWCTVEVVELPETRFLGFAKDITRRKEMEEVLRTHQLELEMQNDELLRASDKAKVVSKKYTELYDFAPSGYFTLSAEKAIKELNHSGAIILGKQRSHVIGSQFGFFVSKNTLPVFNVFFLNVFNSKAKEICEVTIETEGNPPKYVHIEGMVVGKGKQCLLNVIDITVLKQTEEVLRNSESKMKMADEQKSALEQMHKLSEYVEKARENERIAISRELHDDLGQALTAVKIDLALIKQHVSDGEVVLKINKVSDLVSETIKSVQRLTSQLRPPILDDLGLLAAIEWYTEEFAQRIGFKVSLDMDSGIAIPTDASLIIFRIMQESLTNIARHSRATRADIRINKTGDCINFCISDNGIGIPENEIKSKKSFGIISMRERAASMGGTFDIYNENGCGTIIKITFPLNFK